MDDESERMESESEWSDAEDYEDLYTFALGYSSDQESSCRLASLSLNEQREREREKERVAVKVVPTCDYSRHQKGTLSTKLERKSEKERYTFYLEALAKAVGPVRASRLLTLFADYDQSKNRVEQDKIIKECICACASQFCVRTLFRIGGPRFARLKAGRDVSTVGPGRGNGSQVTDVMVAYFKNHVQSWDLEEGFACSHRRMKFYLPNGFTWKTLWGDYQNACERDSVRSMAYKTWMQYRQVILPHVSLNKIKEDECDVCVKLKASLTDKSLSCLEKEKVRIELCKSLIEIIF